jgi:Ca2+-binding RTX toxin-like protein
VTGGARCDLLTGGRGDDILNGGGGKNILVGGAGDDTLISGADRDMFSYRNVNHGVDLIRGFQVGVDVIDLRAIFRKAAFQVQGQTRY